MDSADPGRTRRWWLNLMVVGVAVLFAVPFVYLLLKNLGAGSTFWDVSSSSDAIGPLVRSLALATATSVGASFVGTSTAWLVTRTDVPGRRVWQLLLPLPLVIPSFIGAFVLIAAFAPGGALESMLAPLGVGRLPTVKGFTGSFLVLTLLTYPYVYLPVAARLRQVQPSLEESARLLGARSFGIFARVVLPQVRGAVLAGGLLVFLYTISDFGVVQLMRYDALTREIYATRVFDRSTSLALSLQLGVLALLVVTMERIIAKGPRRLDPQRLKRSLTIPLGRARLLGLGSLSLVVGLALVVPVAVLVWWTLRGAFGRTSGSGAIFRNAGDLLGPLVNTASISLAAALVSTVLLAPLAYVTVRRRNRIAETASAVVVAAFALPGLAIALAFVSMTVNAPGPFAGLYQTLPLLVLAYTIHFGAQSLRTAQVAVASVPVRVEDAARVLGANRWRRLWRIELPLMAPGLLAGGGIVLLSAMKELPATLLLAPAGFQTLATDIWQATESAFFADASLASLVLIALSGVLTWVLVIRRAEVFV